MKEGEKGELASKAEARYTVEAFYKGFRMLLTLPFENGGVVIGVLDKMAELGFTGERTIYQAPRAEVAGPESPEHEKQSDNGKENGYFCPIHQTEMRKFEKDGRSWYSHKTDTGWCNGKGKKN